jgi:SAM-dependent methyltransferase
MPSGALGVPADRGGFDAELRRHNQVLRRACAIRPDDRVLDVGCGSGQTTRQAARTAHAGGALGVDIAAPAIDRARELARAAGLDNVAFECADAQVHRFGPERFDLAMSRFGTMFFADPAAAFANIGRALRPGGRLVMLVWQSADRNEWDIGIRAALHGPAAPHGAAPHGAALAGAGAGGAGGGDAAVADPFSLAEPAVVGGILRGAGFVDVGFAEVREPVFYGPDVDTALGWVRGFSCTSTALAGMDASAAEGAVRRLRELLAGHLSADGVWFDSRAWIVTARRGGKDA